MVEKNVLVPIPLRKHVIWGPALLIVFGVIGVLSGLVQYPVVVEPKPKLEQSKLMQATVVTIAQENLQTPRIATPESVLLIVNLDLGLLGSVVSRVGTELKLQQELLQFKK